MAVGFSRSRPVAGILTLNFTKAALLTGAAFFVPVLSHSKVFLYLDLWCRAVFVSTETQEFHYNAELLS
jgi:hypothetical protein